MGKRQQALEICPFLLSLLLAGCAAFHREEIAENKPLIAAKCEEIRNDTARFLEDAGVPIRMLGKDTLAIKSGYVLITGTFGKYPTEFRIERVYHEDTLISGEFSPAFHSVKPVLFGTYAGFWETCGFHPIDKWAGRWEPVFYAAQLQYTGHEPAGHELKVAMGNPLVRKYASAFGTMEFAGELYARNSVLRSDMQRLETSAGEDGIALLVNSLNPLGRAIGSYLCLKGGIPSLREKCLEVSQEETVLHFHVECIMEKTTIREFVRSWLDEGVTRK